ncbi:EAL domain-containing protein [Anaeroselena agilis]|uniref:EAL domain-containing protein n=1 Tax=Anaeroselena agilis TaxID=3063788 RepID=A0ABU3P1D4_9FIRM|nr:EAL domain-containing protein [Selenomonadales bacterium 4137-cl]
MVGKISSTLSLLRRLIAGLPPKLCRQVNGGTAAGAPTADAIRQREDALTVSKTKLALAAKLANLGPWELDPVTNVFEFDDDFYAIYGTDVAREGRFMPLEVYAREFMHPDDLARVAAVMNGAIASPERVSFGQVVHRIIRRDGEVRTIMVRSNYVKDEHGRLVRAFGANQDITERVRAEEEARKREEALIASRTKLALAAKMANLGPWELNVETQIFEFDDEFYAIYGTDAAREGRFMPLEVYVREFVHPEDRWKIAEATKKALAAREPVGLGQLEHRIIRRDGEVRTIMVRSNYVKDDAGKMVRSYGANQDITERVRAEEEARKREEALIASRTKLAVAAKLADLGPWELNTETNVFEFDDEFYAIYGTDVAREGRFMPLEVYVREFVHPDDRWKVAEVRQRALASQEPVYLGQTEHRIVRRDGEVRTIVARANYVKDEAGRLIRSYGANQDITERVRAEEALREQEEIIRQMAFFDSLTGLPNRRQLQEWLNKEMERARSGISAGVLLFIDLDDLKMVNDTFGHTCGDDIIVAAGRSIVASAGEEAFVSRVGGDEFIVILPGESNRQRIGAIAERIISALGQTHEIYGTFFHMTASIGISTYPADGDTAEEVIKNADNAMYAAKRKGKNCWQLYTMTMQASAYEEMRLTGSLRGALEREELSLHYQPQFLATGAIIGFEALLRWNSSELGAIPPLQFIPLAEKSGFIHSIGQWVLREACQFIRRLTDQGWDGIRIAVNISSKQLAVDNFCSIVRGVIQEAGIAPSQLELEITESVLVTSFEDATSKLAELKALGVRLSLDDFGTAYSSLTYLRSLPVETLKIDKSFVDMITTDIPAAKIIGAIIQMAHILNIAVVAEGVETEQQLAFLRDNGCDRIQGFIFSKPLPEPEAVGFLAKNTEK